LASVPSENRKMRISRFSTAAKLLKMFVNIISIAKFSVK
jgi:hypothetical protein